MNLENRSKIAGCSHVRHFLAIEIAEKIAPIKIAVNNRACERAFMILVYDCSTYRNCGQLIHIFKVAKIVLSLTLAKVEGKQHTPWLHNYATLQEEHLMRLPWNCWSNCRIPPTHTHTHYCSRICCAHLSIERGM